MKDLVDRYVAEGPLPLDRLMRPVVFVQDSLAADRVVTQLREKRVHSGRSSLTRPGARSA